MAHDYRRPADEALIEAERELVYKELEIKRLEEQLEAAEERLAFFDRILALPSDLWVAALLAPADAPYPARKPS